MLKRTKDIDVVGEAGNGIEALEQVRYWLPDVVLLDIRMPGASGLQIVQRVREVCPEAKIIVLTSYDDDEYLFGALRAGAHGYLLKSVAHERLAEAIRTVHAGNRLLSPDLIGRVLKEFESLSQQLAKQEINLSKREVQILRLIAAGYTNKEIAQEQHWSEVTVKRKVSAILTKLNVTTRAQAVAEAVKRGII